MVLIARAAEGDYTADFGVLGQAGSRGGTMGTSGEDDIIPTEVCFVFVEKVTPLTLWVLFGKVLDELVSAFLERIGFCDRNFIGMVFARGGLEANVSPAMFRNRVLLTTDRKPPVGVVDPDGVKTLLIECLKEVFVVTHEPDDELTSR